MREGYAVQVLKWGEPILTIEPTMLSGKSYFTREEGDQIRAAAEHLASFIGDGKPHPCFVCGGVENCENECPLMEAN